MLGPPQSYFAGYGDMGISETQTPIAGPLSFLAEVPGLLLRQNCDWRDSVLPTAAAGMMHANRYQAKARSRPGGPCG